MRSIALFFLTVLAAISAAAQTRANADLPALERACAQLVATVRAPIKMEVLVPIASQPEAVKALKPVRVTVSEEGLYISTARSGDHESGLFYLANDTPDWRTWAHPPVFVQVSSRLYKFDRLLQ